MIDAPAGVLIRAETPADQAAIRAVVEAAFGRPDEANLVDALRRDGDVLLSLVAEQSGAIVGHVLFHRLPIVDPSGEPLLAAASLAPLAVSPERQRQGIGALLVQAGLSRLRECGTPAVFVLGEPHYYGRFGFSSAVAAPIDSPYACPENQALELTAGALAGETGRVVYPRAFDGLS